MHVVLLICNGACSVNKVQIKKKVRLLWTATDGQICLWTGMKVFCCFTATAAQITLWRNWHLARFSLKHCIKRPCLPTLRQELKHCILESFPALLGHNILWIAVNMATLKLLEKSYFIMKHKVLHVSSWTKQTNIRGFFLSNCLVPSRLFSKVLHVNRCGCF